MHVENLTCLESCKIPLPCALASGVRKQWEMNSEVWLGPFTKATDLPALLAHARIYKNHKLMHLFLKMSGRPTQKNIFTPVPSGFSLFVCCRRSEGLFPVSVPTQRFSLEVLSRRPLCVDHTQATADFSPEPHSANESKSIIKTQTLQMDKTPYGTQSFQHINTDGSGHRMIPGITAASHTKTRLGATHLSIPNNMAKSCPQGYVHLSAVSCTVCLMSVSTSLSVTRMSLWQR